MTCIGFYYWLNSVDKKVILLQHKLLRRLLEESCKNIVQKNREPN
jgi:hypothetical protein